jgi:putative zinc finger protein
MVSCKRVLDELSYFIDGDIDPELKGEIEGHVKTCSGALYCMTAYGKC